jgi:tetratricopeptide (TPR) repeat protein/cellulose biosynthesis protein BcsQ
MSTGQTSGKIITFYSYKGGTGRSMTLANVAWILASNRKRVLVLDWDLEAPGLHRYFRPFLIDKDLTSSEGVIDFIIDFADEATKPLENGQPMPPDWYLSHADITRYALSLNYEDFPKGGKIDFVPAGRQGASYATRVNSFNWQHFYDRWSGGAFLEAVKKKVREKYDYILIDSRTGVSDTAGICTVQMPDQLVVCFTLNNQSIEGASAVANSVYKQRKRANSDIEMFPVPMRIELAELEKLEFRKNYAKGKFSLFPTYLTGHEAQEQYWQDVEILYIPYYAYEEILATFRDESGGRGSLLAPTEQLTSYLTHGEVQKLNPPLKDKRRDVLAQYEGRPLKEFRYDPLQLPQLEGPHRHTLIALSLFVPSALRPALAEVAGFAQDLVQLSEVLDRLDNLRLVTFVDGGQRLMVESRTREIAKAHLLDESGAMEILRRFIKHFVRYAEAHARPTATDLNLLEADKDNVLSAITIASNQGDWQSILRITNALTNPMCGLLNVRGDWDEVIQYNEQARVAVLELKDELLSAQLNVNTASVLTNRGEYDKARILYEQAIDAFRASRDENGLPFALCLFGSLVQNQGDLARGHSLYQESLEISERCGNDNGRAEALHRLGSLAQDQGDFQKARDLFNLNLEISRTLDNQRSTAGALHNLGLLSHDQGDLAGALDLYNESLEIRNNLNDALGIANTLHELGRLAHDQGQVTEARRLYNQSLEMKRKLGYKHGVAITSHELGRLAQERGDLAKAEQYYDESLKISRELKDERSSAITLNEMGRLAAHHRRDFSRAQQLYYEALEIRTRLKDSIGRANTLHELGRLAHDQGQMVEARRLYNQSLELKNRLGYQRGIAVTLDELGSLAQQQGDLAEARHLYERSLEIKRNLEDLRGISVTLDRMRMLPLA